jgi:hypothetical protein
VVSWCKIVAVLSGVDSIVLCWHRHHVKSKFYPITGLVPLKEAGGQHHASAALPLGKTRYPLYRRLGGP